MVLCCPQVFPSHFTQQRCKDLSTSPSDLDARLCLATAGAAGVLGGVLGGARSGGNNAASNVSSVPTNTPNSLGSCVITPQSLGISTDFWDLLVKLDNMNVSRKGKASMKTVPLGGGAEAEGAQFSLEASPLGQLMNMLSHPVIRRSSLLTEKLLRLLSLISIALPDNKATEVPAGHPTPQTASASTAAGAAGAAAAAVAAPATGLSTLTAGSAQVAATGLVGAVVQGSSSLASLAASHMSASAASSLPTSTVNISTGKHRWSVLVASVVVLARFCGLLLCLCRY